MSSINWPEILTIFVGFGAFFVYLMSRLDGAKKEIRAEIKDLDKKTDGVRKDLNLIAMSVSNIEGQITQMTRPESRIRQYDGPPEDRKAQGE